jgi:NAD(P)-dependent dehydrogenase (short-subunit alcohol dehydrogenase family)
MKMLVTGASSGIGRAFACRASDGPNRVMGTYLTRPNSYAKAGTPVNDGLDNTGVEYSQWDVREDSPLEVRQFAQGCPVFVHCAGITYLAPYETMDMSQVRAVIDTNVLGTINLIRLAAAMAYHDGPRAVPPRIIIVSSVAAYTPMRLSAAYNASKAAQDALVRQAARELGDRFSVIGIRPGYVKETKLADYVMEQACSQRDMTEKGFHAYNMKTSITGRYPTMDEVVETILWAATEAPAQALTGSFLNPSCGS